jgi:hypothetical protein
MLRQTAVKWYTEQLRRLAFDSNHHFGLGDIRLTQGQIDELYEQAIAMEKEQIMKTARQCHFEGVRQSAKNSEEYLQYGEQYYNETYGK